MVFSTLAIVFISLIVNTVPTYSLPIPDSTPPVTMGPGFVPPPSLQHIQAIPFNPAPGSGLTPRDIGESDRNRGVQEITLPSVPKIAGKVLDVVPPTATPGGPPNPNGLPNGVVPPGLVPPPDGSIPPPNGIVPPAPTPTGASIPWSTVTVASPAGTTVYLLPGALVANPAPSAPSPTNTAVAAGAPFPPPPPPPPNNAGYFLCAPPGVTPPPGVLGFPPQAAPTAPPTVVGVIVPPQASPTPTPQPNSGNNGNGSPKKHKRVRTTTRFVTVTETATATLVPQAPPIPTVVVQPGSQ